LKLQPTLLYHYTDRNSAFILIEHVFVGKVEAINTGNITVRLAV